MRMLSRLFRMFSSGRGRTTTRGGMGSSRGMGTATRSRGGIGSLIRRFLR
jgi:hypothetical protein